MIATVKGDVHDIGKNIVTVVLQCNNFEVVNMGVMVPCHEILAKAKEEGADIVGLSGLITPSLEEMQYVAGEMQKDAHFRDAKIPLLIGGATTSRVHTAVKIAQHYEGPVVYVPDASRSVSVAQSLIGDSRVQYIAELNADYERVRTQHANKKQVPMWSIDKARANKTPIDWAAYQPVKPKFIGKRVFKNFDLAEIAQVHRLGPVLPDLGPRRPLPGDPHRRGGGRAGEQGVCRRAGHAQEDHRRPLAQRQRRDRPVPGQHGERRRHRALHRREPQRRGADLARPAPADREAGNRRSGRKADDAPQPLPGRLRRAQGRRPTTTWACSRSPPVWASRRKEQQFLDAHDDYNAILFKSLADRLAESFAECLHHRVRTDLWGYAADETPEQRRR